MTTPAETTNLMWTGGWDSTFRLLWLTLQEGRKVQPYYVVSPTRGSSALELQAIENVRTRLAERLGHQPIEPLVSFDRTKLTPNPTIKAAYERLNKCASLAGQYVWLAQWAEEQELDALEFGIHHGDKAYPFIKREVGDPSDVEILFKRFRFPILDMTKREMADLARKHDFIDLMELSRFCYSPKNEPCGHCPPCLFTIEEGLGYRIPWQGHLKHQIYRIVWPPLKFYKNVRNRILGRELLR